MKNILSKGIIISKYIEWGDRRMFGYVVPAPDALSDDDKLLWQSFYCTLCRQIGKRSQPARLGLSYDLTFLALLIAGLSHTPPKFEGSHRCILHPTKKTNIYEACDAFDYAADASVILIKAKLDDDRHDENNPLYSVASYFIKDNEAKQATLRDKISTSLFKLSEIEKENLLDVDLAADAFAVLCGELFRLSPTPESEKKALYWLGYNLGRWIYLIDALEDLESDIKKGSYNPFAKGGSFEEITLNEKSAIEEMLYFTLSEAASAYDLLSVKRYSSLLENIIYVGLPARLNEIMHKKGKNAV